jgi:hypothetical protein
MATAHVNESKLVLKYDDTKGNYTFKSFVSGINDEELYEIAGILNGFQENRVNRILKVTTKIIM